MKSSVWRLCVCMLLLGVCARVTAVPTITGPTAADPNRTVTASQYTATIGNDGCLTSFKIGETEFLANGIDVSRGMYFFQGSRLNLTNITQPAPNVIAAQSDKATIRYEFGDASVTCTATNPGTAPLLLYTVFVPDVQYITDDKATVTPLPATQPTPGAVNWIGGTAKIQTSGSDKIWGPWTQGTEVMESALAPGASRTFTLTAAETTPAELAALTKFTAPPPLQAPGFAVLSPLNYQVFQRKTRDQGAIRVSGPLASGSDQVQARVTGKPLHGALPGTWQPLSTDPVGRSFFGSLPTPAGGWYTVQVRTVHADKTTTTITVDKVGVGEVFLGAGQSNSTNYGQFTTKQESGMVSTFSGSAWRLADDPQPGTHDQSQGGSFWPAFGDAMYARYHVPIGVATTGHGGTSVAQWQPGGELYKWTMTRILQFGPQGFRALLWHQGEADTSMRPDLYAHDLDNLIRTSQAEAGWQFPWFVAQVSYHSPTDPSSPSTRNAQKQLWDLGVALPGPDTDTLTGDNRGYNGTDVHMSPKGLKAHGLLWADKVGAYLDKALANTDH